MIIKWCLSKLNDKTIFMSMIMVAALGGSVEILSIESLAKYMFS